MITADVAHRQSNEHNINKASEEIKYCENAIVEAINQGRFCVALNKQLMSETVECLRSCGYTVTATAGFDDTILIEW